MASLTWKTDLERTISEGEEDDENELVLLWDNGDDNESVQYDYTRTPLTIPEDVQEVSACYPQSFTRRESTTTTNKGMTRVSSCYLSIHSEQSVTSLKDLLANWDTESFVSAASLHQYRRESSFGPSGIITHDTILYHDILMQIFSFLNLDDLRCFSEVSTKANFECFDYLSTQLDVCVSKSAMTSSSVDSSSTERYNTECLSRLHTLEPEYTEKLVQEYAQTIYQHSEVKPLQAVRYLRLHIEEHGLEKIVKNTSLTTRGQVFGSFLFMAAIFGGAASIVSSQEMELEISPMFKMMGILGSLAAGRIASRIDNDTLERTFASSTPKWLLHQMLQAIDINPTNLQLEELDATIEDNVDPLLSIEQPAQSRGCVGLYRQLLYKVKLRLCELIKTERRTRYDQLSLEEKDRIMLSLVEACASENLVETVKEITQVVDVEAFVTGVDGTETCALHTAALQGSSQTLEYLCRGPHEIDSNLDGGLCNVNLQDVNLWTALHFAAGANAIDNVRVLLKHGANPNVQASNGYTPLQWATRLQNKDVAEVLQQALQQQKQSKWAASERMTNLAKQIFAMLPHS